MCLLSWQPRCLMTLQEWGARQVLELGTPFSSRHCGGVRTWACLELHKFRLIFYKGWAMPGRAQG